VFWGTFYETFKAAAKPHSLTMRLPHFVDQRLIDNPNFLVVRAIKIRPLKIYGEHLCCSHPARADDVRTVAKLIPDSANGVEIANKALKMSNATSAGKAHYPGALYQFGPSASRSRVGIDEFGARIVCPQKDSQNAMKPAFGVCPHHYQNRQFMRKLAAQLQNFFFSFLPCTTAHGCYS
jgi:hypothetical protein